MNFTNVKLILFREIRDQLRDRRTLFMIFVLPILLYPLLGMSFLQIQTFMQKKPVTIWVIGAEGLEVEQLRKKLALPQRAKELEKLPEKLALLENDRFAADLFTDPKEARLLKLLHFAPKANQLPGNGGKSSDRRAEALRMVQSRRCDAALYFPEQFAVEMDEFILALQQEPQGVGGLQIPRPDVISTTANGRSVTAHRRLTDVLDQWTKKVGETILAARGVPITAARPFDFNTVDVAGKTSYRGAAMWSKILPVLMLIWALTGAFYPAVDLCAGEKERGTLETLLCSPAERSEIVVGKLLTIMIFSMATAILNLLSIGLTGLLVSRHIPEMGPPPPTAIFWLAAALVPISALFSALCLALAAFARSSKEGQYYLMPLLLITMPLALLPMAPGVELNLGNSLIPVTGIVVLLRSLLEGDYLPALQFLPVVVAVTLAACLLAIRWAVDQFNSESVLFRESEQLDVGLWFKHLFRDRQPTPTVAAALACGVLILLIQFFVSLGMKSSGGTSFSTLAILSQVGIILAPALLMTFWLTRSPRQTLLLTRPAWLTLPAAVLLAIVFHPALTALKMAVVQLYPMDLELAESFGGNLPQESWHLLLLLAVLPAICEEFAFRGFILSGFRHLGHKWRAILYTAVLFGITHTILQQQLIAAMVGIVIGYLAVQTGSIFPCMLFHMTHNALGLISVKLFTPELLQRWPWLKMIVVPSDVVGHAYHWSVVIASGVLAAGMLVWFSRLPYPKSAEEELQEAIHQADHDDRNEPRAASQQEADSSTPSELPTPAP